MTERLSHTITIQFIPRRTWLALGPGWAVLAATLATRKLQFQPDFWLLNSTLLINLAILWFLVDPVLGTIWQLLVEQDIWHLLNTHPYPLQTKQKPLLPYLTKNAMAYRFITIFNSLWSQNNSLGQTLLLHLLIAFGLATVLGIPVILFVSIFIIGSFLIGQKQFATTTIKQQLWQSIAMFLLPYLVALQLINGLHLKAIILGLAYWIIYLGLLQLMAHQPKGNTLVITAQAVIAIFLFSLTQAIAGAVVIIIMLFTLLLQIQNKQQTPPNWQKYTMYLNPFLLIALFTTAISIGGGG